MYSGKEKGMMKERVILAAIGAAMVMGLGGCGNSAAPAASATATERTEGSAERTDAETADAENAAGNASDAEKEADTAAGESVRIGNPFTDVNSVSEAEEMTGFSITVPEAPAEYPDMDVRVMLDSMIEIIFENKARETEDAIEEGYRIRKEAGAEDISGDYNEYAEVSTVTVDGREVTMKGNDGTVSLAVWTADGYSYSVGLVDRPVTAEEMTEILEDVE